LPHHHEERVVSADLSNPLGSTPPRRCKEFITTLQGYRLVTSNGGVLTGRGADIILIDDPLKPEEALSDAQRKTANEWFVGALSPRCRFGPTHRR
jgi:hypothetical protein